MSIDPDVQPKNAAGRRATFLRRLAVTVLILAVSIGFWDGILKYRVIAKRFGAVIPGKVYRSGQISRHMIRPTLEKHDIQVIVDLTGPNPDDPDQQMEMEVARELGVEHLRFPLGGDGTGDVRNYAAAVESLAECERQGKPVLVHCSAGAQRTGGVVAAYRLLVREEPVDDVYREMKSYGWRPHRDLELVPYLNENLDEIAAILVDRGVIAEAPSHIPVIGANDSAASVRN